MSQGDIETATIFTRAIRKIQSKFTALVSDISGKADIAGQVFTGEIVYRGGGGVSTNTSYGTSTLSSNTSGDGNTANGNGCLDSNTEGFSSTGCGKDALGSAIDGNNNTAGGRDALGSVTSGSDNSSFGRSSGLGITTGSGNNIFGAGVTGLAPDLENNLILASGGVIRLQHDATTLTVTGGVKPSADNTVPLGTAPLRWSEVFAGTGTINTSDAREKTSVRSMNELEVSAAKDMGKEIGVYQFLSSIKEKGEEARHHVGLTVQRAVEIMTERGLDPFSYGFICFDEWHDVFVEHAGIEATEETEAKAAWTEQTRKAGNLYGFRYDQLNLFIAKGIEARLSALEDSA
jgi:hypothetical protein